MKKTYIIPVLLALAIAIVSCVDEPDMGEFPTNKYYYDIPDVPVETDYVIGVMYHELNETYWFRGIGANNQPDFSQPLGYTGTPKLGNPDQNGGYYIRKDYYNNGKILRQQLDWAKQAGIDFLLVNWNRSVAWNNAVKVDTFMLNFANVWKPGDPKIAFVFDCGHLHNIGELRDFPEADSLHVNHKEPPSLLYPNGKVIGPYDDGRGTKETFLGQLDSLKNFFFNEPYYYKLADGRPLLGLNGYERTNNVQSTIKDVRDTLGIGVYLISPTIRYGNGYTSIHNIYNIYNTVRTGRKDANNRDIFKEVYLFRENGGKNGNPQMPFDAMYQPAMLTNEYARHGEGNWRRNYFSIVDFNYNEWKRKLAEKGADYIPSIMPAFDDSNRTDLSSPSRIFIHEREPETGELYKSYANVGKRNANSTRRIILINSWNDFRQGSGLEPTEEYGESYLNFTKKYFKKN